MPQAWPAEYSNDIGADQVVLGFVGDILLSVLGGEVSGFTTSTLAATASTIADSRAGKNGPHTPVTRPSAMATTTTSSVPVMILGQGGLSPCVEYLSNEQGHAPGIENYCFCDGINAPLRLNTVGGTVVSDCSYSTMPTRGWTPTITAGYSSSTPPSSTPPSSPPPPSYLCTMM